MRHWLFHPILFYPLALAFAALVIGLSIQPQAWPRPPAPVAGNVEQQILVLDGSAFDTPDPGIGQNMTITRDFLGRPRSLRIAQIPAQPAPRADEHGVRVLLAAESATLLRGQPVVVEVSYTPLPFNAASGLAVSLRGDGASGWVSQQAPPQQGVLRFDLPANPSANALGLRALSDGTDQAYGLEITRIKIWPRPPGPPTS
jgi:hypothetical protein